MPPLNVEDYHVGWICALPSELAAGKAMLDEQHEMIAGKDPLDSNSYALGRMQGHNIVMACLPAGVDGTNAAAVVATNLLRSFKSVRFGLMVGIGGGIPDIGNDRDIRLGDIAVSQPSGTNGGVIQYDKGKSLDDGQFQRKGQLNRPPTTLLTALQSLQAEHEMEDSKVPQYLEELVARYPKMRKNGYILPVREVDVLRCTDCHKTQSSCDMCENGEMKREPRESTDPEIHYGVIASGNQVIKSAVEREQIRTDCEAICVEMEAAGLMNDFPCLVIRGICDYADSFKNDKWHKYAAVTAAAFAKELLHYVSAEQTNHEKPIQQVVDILKQHVDDTRQYFQQQQEHNLRQESKYQNDKEKECHRAFKTSVYADHKNINPDPLPGTCLWVLQNSSYTTWRDSLQNDLLWISADPGCGKSVLAKYVVDSCLRPSHETKGEMASTTKLPHTICYFFFKDNEIQDNLPGALCAILHQLFTQQPRLISHALPTWETNGNKLLRDTDELWRILLNAAGDPDAEPVTCIFDALDECRDGDRRRLIDLICSFCGESRGSDSPHGCFKILLTSRPYYSIQSGFDRLLFSLPSIQLRGEDKSHDIHTEIDLVAKAKVSELSHELHLSATVKQRIEDKLLETENRTYLWLHLAIEDIRITLQSSLRPNQETFAVMPASVEQAYEKLLNRGVGNKSNVKMILSIIVGARRPLTVEELALAIDMATSTTPVESMSDLTIDPEHLERNIRDWCGLFVFFNHKMVHLVHQTAKEFLLGQEQAELTRVDTWKHSLRPSGVEQNMARVCVEFLCLSDFDQTSTKLQQEVTEDKKEDLHVSSIPQRGKSFFVFTAQYWAYHVRRAIMIDDDTMKKIRSLYDTTSKRYNYILETSFNGLEYLGIPPYMDEVDFAAFNGHIKFLQTFLDSHPTRINVEKGKDGGLMWAAMQGHEDVVAMLLRKGARMSNATYSFDNALMLAAGHGHERVVEMLLDAGADVNNAGDWNALQKGALHGHLQTVRTLLAAGAAVDTQGSESGDALYLASAFGHEKIVQSLLEAGADINAQGGFLGTPLAAASWHGHTQIVRTLLGAKADVNVLCGEFGTALQAASSMGHDDVVRMLLENGARVNDQGGKYGNALQAAAVDGYDDVVEILLKAKADVNAVGGEYGTALAAAIESGDEDIIQMLIGAGAKGGS